MSKNIRRELTVPCDTSHLSKLRVEVLGVLRACAFSPVKANLIALAVDEAVANIIEHSYGDELNSNSRPPDVIEVVLDVNPQRFEVLIRDHGRAFDPRDIPNVDIRRHAQVGRKGGLGIFLMRRIMDEINYSYKQGVHNELQMIKYVDDAVLRAKNRGGSINK